MSFEIIQIIRDKDSIRKYVERYKEFRLLSLKTSPQSFGSTLERELAFTDEIWYNRLANPQAVTFIALQGERVIGTLTTVGPLPFGVEEYVYPYVLLFGLLLFFELHFFCNLWDDSSSLTDLTDNHLKATHGKC